EGRVVSTVEGQLAPERRSVGMVFQNYALWPHMTALQTVAYPMRRRGHSKRSAGDEALRLLELVGIGELAHRMPAELSGGQQQRVGLARALGRRADLYLFDEPTAHLDSTVKLAVQAEIRRRRAETGAAALYSTHDSGEALAIADRVALLREGRVVQVGTPTEVYERPVDRWAGYITGPVSEVTIERLDSNLAIDGDANTDRCLVRPEWVEPGGPVSGIVEEVSYRGPHTDYVIATIAGQLHFRSTGLPKWSVGDTTTWSVTRVWRPPG
ncbi:MAG TPA: ABC transporter ATP-binding protein, partial [Acidimicrobiia bacterium]|nr:ABC transporter ATP-binding protein [Acidimicrobiia bacterium]